MARLIRVSRRTLFSNSLFSSKTLISKPKPLQFQNPILTPPLFQTRNYMSEMRKSTFEGHILRVLRNEIQYELEYAPPKQAVKEFNSFKVDDCPGEQWIRLRSNNGKEEVKIEVTMFDGVVPTRNKSGNEETQLHISLIVDVSKGDTDIFQFVCSAWPDSIEVEKVFFHNKDGKPRVPYMGPDFEDLNDELQNSLREFLEERGVNDELAVFLHEYMMNKDRTELIRWMENVKSFVEK